MPFRIIALFLCAFLCNCSKNANPSDCKRGFDERALLKNYVDNFILPAFQDLQKETENLRKAAIAFSEQRDQSKLISLQNSLKTTWAQWQFAAPFAFGAAEEVNLLEKLNTFPNDKTQTEINIASDEYNLNDDDSNAEMGFPALDFLLFGSSNNEINVARLRQEKYNDYVFALISDLKNRVDHVTEIWEMEDTRSNFYRDKEGNSLEILLKGLQKHMDRSLNQRLEQTTQNAKDAEGFYSGLSLSLLKTATESSQTIYKNGLEEYLIYVGTAIKGAQLSDLIEQQFEKVNSTLDTIDGKLTTAVENQPNEVEMALEEMRILNELMTEELPAALCVEL